MDLDGIENLLRRVIELDVVSIASWLLSSYFLDVT